MQKLRKDGRSLDQLRKIKITPHVSEYAEGSVMVEFGKTKVLCTASYEEQTPKWLQNSGKGWITAEYGMLPRATHSRVKREKNISSGRTLEIARLIGRSLRAAVDLKKLNERQLIVDCDVLLADGGTRTAAVTGGFVALALALKKLKDVGEIKENPLIQYVSAVSVGFSKDSYFLDLDYDEDSNVGADMNFVMTSSQQFVEIQGTAETQLFGKSDFMGMMDLAERAGQTLFELQAEIVGSFFPLSKT